MRITIELNENEARRIVRVLQFKSLEDDRNAKVYPALKRDYESISAMERDVSNRILKMLSKCNYD